MSAIGQPERATQNRVIALFRDELGYRYGRVAVMRTVMPMFAAASISRSSAKMSAIRRERGFSSCPGR